MKGKSMNKLLVIALIAITFTACKQNNKGSGNEGSYTLSGKLRGLGNDSIFLVNRTEDGTAYDTAIAKNDSFSFTGKCPIPRVYTLQWYRKGQRLRAEIFMENAPICVTGN